MILFLLVACSTPGKYPLPLKNQAFDSMESFRTYFLKGRLCDAEIAFHEAVDLYARIDDMCAISNAYIQKYLFNAYVKNERTDILEKANEFAVIGNCSIEKQKINDLKLSAEEGVTRLDPDKAPNDLYRSVSLRRAAVTNKERKRAEQALTIDRDNAWTLFVIHDLMIIKLLSDDEEEKDNIQKRIDFLSGYIQECK